MTVLSGLVILLCAAGLAAFALLFWRLPTLSRSPRVGEPAIRVVIPARDEECTIGLLLGDLANQTLAPAEILVVDDGSSDATAEIAASLGARVVPAAGRPEDWNGKAWACHFGARTIGARTICEKVIGANADDASAIGSTADRARDTNAVNKDLILFLDADVRLASDALERLAAEYRDAFGDGEGAVSVQPTHLARKAYEQASLFFNLVLLGAQGIGLPFRVTDLGLFGPVILIDRALYLRHGGHASACGSVVEDLDLGRSIRRSGATYRLLTGGGTIGFRMYPGGAAALWQGWTKNFAAGARRTHPALFVANFLWIWSIAAWMLEVPFAIASGSALRMAAAAAVYLAWFILLTLKARRAGDFRAASWPLFPALYLAFLAIFAGGLFKSVFLRRAVWKGRVVPTDKEG
jgi:4,4'-diaponeurosporenoate glycosyltransferase